MSSSMDTELSWPRPCCIGRGGRGGSRQIPSFHLIGVSSRCRLRPPPAPTSRPSCRRPAPGVAISAGPAILETVVSWTLLLLPKTAQATRRAGRASLPARPPVQRKSQKRLRVRAHAENLQRIPDAPQDVDGARNRPFAPRAPAYASLAGKLVRCSYACRPHASDACSSPSRARPWGKSPRFEETWPR